jgi:hypothetical protein
MIQGRRNIESLQDFPNKVSPYGVSDFMQRNAGRGSVLPTMRC